MEADGGGEREVGVGGEEERMAGSVLGVDLGQRRAVWGVAKAERERGAVGVG